LGCGGKGPETPLDVDAPSASGPPPVPKEEAIPKAERPAMSTAADQAYQAANAAFARGDMDGAEAGFRDALGKDPRAFRAYYALGTVLERKNNSGEAEREYEKSLELVPDFEPPIVALTSLYLRDGRVSQAESFLNRQLSRVPNSAAALAAMAEVKSVQKDSASAQRLAQQALKHDPDYRPAMVVLARDHYRARRLDLALYTLTAILDGYGAENPPRDKNNGEARLLRALIYREQGQRKAAIEELRRAVQLRPDLVEARINLAAYLLEAGNAQEAVPLLEGALPYDPGNVLVHLNLGDGYRLQGRPAEAITQLSWVVQAAPDLAQAHYDLGLVYLFSKLSDKTDLQAAEAAIGELSTYLRMRPRTPVGLGDDAEDLLARAKTKKSVIEAMSSSAGPSEGAPDSQRAPSQPAPANESSSASAPAPAPASAPVPPTSSAAPSEGTRQ
jgi:tetratricopeptide (TPR) repeat protein